MAAIAALSSIVFSKYFSDSPKFSLYSNPLKLHICSVIRPTSIKNPICPAYPLQRHLTTKANFRICSTAQSVALEENTEKTQQENQRRKLCVLNLPWSMTVVDIKSLFSECGTVVDVEIIKQENGKSRGLAFVTMASGEESQAVVDKFDSQEVSGRIIRVEFAKRLKKPPKALPNDPSRGETRHKLYVSNLAWKVRSTHLKEFVSAFNPVSARVVFESPGKSAGYGFVSFTTKEEGEAAIAALDGKELLNRAVRLKFSETNVNESKDDVEDVIEELESETKVEEITDKFVSKSKNESQETKENKLGDS